MHRRVATNGNTLWTKDGTPDASAQADFLNSVGELLSRSRLVMTSRYDREAEFRSQKEEQPGGDLRIKPPLTREEIIVEES